MARRLGPSCRLCRSEGEKLFLKGTKCVTDKCVVAKREFSPGQHGKLKKRSKMSNYAMQLRQKQKAKRIYGILERQFKTYFRKAEKSKGITGEVLLQSLERRLDNVVYRSCFAESRAKARQMVRHHFVNVNGSRVDIPSYLINIGDEVVISAKDDQLAATRSIAESLADRGIPDWIEASREKLSAKVKRLPTKQDIGITIEENLIVELYSK